MPAVTIRNLPEETHRALKSRAAQHGRSTESEIRFILEAAVRPRVAFGTQLAQIGQDLGGIELDFKRDKTPVAAASFE
ncbi:Arc family DNA-binding protein [Rhodoferax sp. U2-2l]|nr:Arc family DNA-binding protein [Rhodoferax sp. U2-2l]MCB8745682.1 Arc family DNA-binding protein [Rhodoferax sp. U2-2l]